MSMPRQADAGCALAIEGLTVAYRRRLGLNTVVSGVDLLLEPGTIHGLVGESGCGKSTTALAAIGYRGPGATIVAGRSLLGDLDLLALPVKALREVWGRRVAYIAQNAGQALNPSRSIGSLLAEPLRVHLGLSGDAERDRSLELLRSVSLPEPERALRRYPHEFSGGQQQRIAIALALACRPDVLVLDEPTTGLDVTTQARISELIRRLVADTRVAALYVSHDLALLSVLAHRLTVMYAGQVVETGPLETLRTTTRHPYTQALLAALPSAREPHELTGIPGEPPPRVILDSCAFAPRCRYAVARCRAEEIPLSAVGDDHRVRCIRATDPEVAARMPRMLRLIEPIATPVAPENALLTVQDVSCFYGESFTAVRDVSFFVLPGETLGLVGESGSGKSTMLRAIAGIHGRSTGSLSYRGAELDRKATRRPRVVRREIQIVFQDPGSSLNPRQTVEQLVGRPVRLFRDEIPRNRERDTVVSLLESVKLGRSLLARYPWELSGGQKQRVALARAFAAQPTLLLCDEVTSALDVSVQATVLDLILELSRQTGTAVVFVSHDLAVVRTVATRALVMQNGEICEQGPVETLFSAPKHPYTAELLAGIPDFAATRAASR
jgi:peptide/nickel transport system ATP-binding protein